MWDISLLRNLHNKLRQRSFAFLMCEVCILPKPVLRLSLSLATRNSFREKENLVLSNIGSVAREYAWYYFCPAPLFTFDKKKVTVSFRIEVASIHRLTVVFHVKLKEQVIFSIVQLNTPTKSKAVLKTAREDFIASKSSLIHSPPLPHQCKKCYLPSACKSL